MLDISLYSVSVHSTCSLEYLIINYCDWPLNLHAIVSDFLIEYTNVIIFVKHSQPETKDNSLQYKFCFIIKVLFGYGCKRSLSVKILAYKK